MADDKTKIQFNKTPAEVLRDRRQKDALTSEQAAAQEHMNGMKRPRQPLGGAPPVRIPPLDADPIEGGGPMSEQASVLQDPTSPLSPVYNPHLAMMAKKAPEERGPFTMVRPEDQADPGFVRGVGAMYSANQPHLRRQQEDRDGYKPVLSDKTRASMEALAAFQAQAQHSQETKVSDQTPEEQKRTEDAAALGKVIEKTETNMYKELQDILGDSSQWNILNNPDRRKAIESRLHGMDITDIIVYGEIRQDVPVLPDKLVLTYRSVAAEEDLAVKQMMFGETGGDRYLMDKYTIMQLTLALVSINGDELPTHLDEKKKFNEEKFLRKFEKVVRFPIQFIADLGIQYLWFDERVRRLFAGTGSEELKNT